MRLHMPAGQLNHPRRLRRALPAVALLCWLPAQPAAAQFAVIDMASVTQLIHEAQTLGQQLQAARAQLTQAQSLYQSMTGSRGMQQWLGSPSPNYLPTDWAQLMAAMQGSSALYAGLAAQIAQSAGAAAVLTGPQLAELSPHAQAAVGASRQSVALLQGLSQQALANSSAQFATIAQLLGAISTTGDQKSILELQATIAAEQGLLQNQQTKLQVLYQAALSEQWAAEQQRREQAIAAQGDFATRFEPSPM